MWRISTAQLLLTMLTVSAPALATERFAIVVGNNQGSGERARLWFAERDAERFAGALKELGEFGTANIRLAQKSSPSAVEATFAETERAIRTAHTKGERTLLVFYFSGHAGPKGLELGGDTLPFSTLKHWVEGTSADVKVAFVDACESGALTQVKGARGQPDLDFALPSEQTANGVAYIASTAVGESAQESAKLGGSFFTFHLEAALRGAGDTDGDGQITLAEAFHYTASKTTTTTSSTNAGPQHPTYDFRMSGRGDVVLSDLRRAQATLSLKGPAQVTYTISNAKGLVAESPGGTTLGLTAGAYHVERRDGSARAALDIILAAGDKASPSQFETQATVAARAKGGASLVELFAGFNGATASVAGQSFLPGVRLGARKAIFDNVSLRLRFDYNGATGNDSGLQYSVRRLSTSLAAMYLFLARVVSLEAGLEAGGAYTWQTLNSGRLFGSAEGLAAATGAASARFDAWFVSLQLSVGLRLFQLNGAQSVGPKAEAALVIGVAL